MGEKGGKRKGVNTLYNSMYTLVAHETYYKGCFYDLDDLLKEGYD